MKPIIRDELGKFYKVGKVYRKGYKAFLPGFFCDPDGNHFKQYRENTVFEENGNTLCSEGMLHASDSISNVLEFYDPVQKTGKLTEFAEVEALSPIKKSPNKWGTTKLKIGRKLSMREVISLLSEETDRVFSYEQTNFFDHNISIGNKRSGRVVHFTGDWAKLLNSGNSSLIYNRGLGSKIINFSDFTEINNFGGCSIIYNRGDFCTIRSFEGDDVTIVCKGQNCKVLCSGTTCKVKGDVGTKITFLETENTLGFYGVKNAKTVIIDGEALKPDRFYTLLNNEFVEVN